MWSKKHKLNQFNNKKEFAQKNIVTISLFSQCLSYVARNLNSVESLVDFPEVIGRQIFHLADREGYFRDWPSSLRLFCAAYGELVLKKLNLNGCHLALGQRLDDLTMFTRITHLDISRCSLGCEHDIYHHFAALTNLTHLNLSNNNLQDSSLQLLTTQTRMFPGRGPFKLQYLNLSENIHITVKVARYLTTFKELKFFDFSGTGILRWNDVASLIAKLRLGSCGGDCRMENWGTEGWAADAVENWIDETKSVVKAKTSQSSDLAFYRHKMRDFTATNESHGTRPIIQRCQHRQLCAYHGRPAYHPEALSGTETTRTMRCRQNELDEQKENAIFKQYLSGATSENT